MSNLKEQTLQFLSKVESNGGRVGSYTCPGPECGALLKTALPDEPDTTWDSAVVCYECGYVHYVIKTMDGVTAKHMEDVGR